MKKVIIWGGTGQAIVLNEFIHLLGYKVTAVFDNNPKVKSFSHQIPIYYKKSGFDTYCSENDVNNTYFLVAIGGDKGRDRIEIANYLKERLLKPISVIHPKANVTQDSLIGEGSQILINSTICSKVTIGSYCIINSSSSIDHESSIGNGVHIGPGAILAGNVQIANCTFIGSGATILPNLKIGANTVIGAGSVVTKNIPDNVVAFGNPAKIIRNYI